MKYWKCGIVCWSLILWSATSHSSPESSVSPGPQFASPTSWQGWIDDGHDIESCPMDSSDTSRSGSPRSLPREFSGVPLEVEAVEVEGAAVPATVYRAALQAGARYDVPASILIRLAREESGIDTTASRVTVHEDSWGLLQANRRGGLGLNYSVAELKDPEINFDIGAKAIRHELDKGATMYEALWPWENARRRMWGE